MNKSKKILMLEWQAFGFVEAYAYFLNAGYEVTLFSHLDYRLKESEDFDKEFSNAIHDSCFDIAFSFNYHPIFSNNCQKYGIKYISIVYDSPHSSLYSPSAFNDVNYIFHFDSSECAYLQSLGVKNIFYSPLPVNGEIIQKLLRQPYDIAKSTCDVSFVGALYDEKDNFYNIIYPKLSEYNQGFLNGIINSQRVIYGANLVSELLTDDLINNMKSVYDCTLGKFGLETDNYIYSNYVVNKKITELERKDLLSDIAARYPLKLFTLNTESTIAGAINMGIADYYELMPYIFSNSKINLNITLRSIYSGIPLRAMDIFANGGFLLSNFQSDFLIHFTPDEDFVYFGDKGDLIEKVEFYLRNDGERERIAKNGYEKVCREHSYKVRFEEIFKVVSDS